ncbi:hypothetical protein FBU59_007014 [Linderina macrospora]|uniref:Uncharacterized protein n=1 Tax=Linderina macrospora TaxID=4868 RepID=A0ACC1IYE6_9FUNG|nr:hypothetical protein FBU59_007014 [Linderina macrospora]
MVMLLPAQIPVQDLVKLKRLTKKGRAQLVNMQLDSLIKPDLFQAAMQANDDVPLLARKEIIAQSQNPASAAVLSGVLQPQFSTPNSMMPATAVGSVTTTVGSPGSVGSGLPQQQQQQPVFQRRMNVLDDGLSTSQSPLPLSPHAIVPPAPIALHPAHVQPINTNLVIDNNMAETLVNYFYMVASSQNQRSSTSSERAGSISSTTKPALPTIGAAMVNQQSNGLPDLASLTSPQSFLNLKDQQPQMGSVQQSPQQLFSSVYNPATMQKFPDEDSGSFV